VRLRDGAARHKLHAMRETAKRPSAWYVISLRPVGQHDAVRRAAAHAGIACVAISPMRIAARDDATTRARLRDAIAAPIAIFTSPNAVRAAAGLASLRRKRGQRTIAIGAGTAAALRRAGVADVRVPERADSDALLDMAALQAIDGVRVGLVTAPGGRDRIAPGLRARGADVVRADVYARTPRTLGPRDFAKLRQARGRPAIALSSAEALHALMDQAPADIAATLRRARILAGSERLADEARGLGFDDIRLAAGARPADLVAALARARDRRS
jgi:uroporphyrinogen-III synthase